MCILNSNNMCRKTSAFVYEYKYKWVIWVLHEFSYINIGKPPIRAFVNTWANVEKPVDYLAIHMYKQISAEKQT